MTFISSTASYFKQPIANAVVAMTTRGPGNRDTDDIFLAVLLSAAMFEAYMARASYFDVINRHGAGLAPFEKAVERQLSTGRDLMHQHFSAYGAAGLEEVDEVYALRDALTHNHLWEYELDESGKRTLLRRLFGGNRAFENCVAFDKEPVQTKRLGLPVVPGDQSRASLREAFAALWRALDYVSNLDSRVLSTNGAAFNVRVPLQVAQKLFGGSAGVTVALPKLVAKLPN